MTIKSGQTLILTTGCYSDWQYHGPFLVLKDIDDKILPKEYENNFVKENYWDEPDQNGFIAYLSTNGFIEDMPNIVTWHLGDYSLEPDGVKT